MEAGDGPLVLLVHGFPESWYSWRHQLPALAEAGYRAVAIDVRGYGRSSKPLAVEAYRMVRLVADNVGLVDALGFETAVVVGHDWGAPIAWNSALLRPDVFTAVAGLSVPFAPPSDVRPTDDVPGDRRRRGVLHRVLPGARPGRGRDRGRRARLAARVHVHRVGRRAAARPERRHRRHRAPRRSDAGSLPPTRPAAGVAHRGRPRRLRRASSSTPGLRGPLNRYRNVDRDWEDLAAFRGAPIDVPALFIGGDRDGPTIWGTPAIAAFPQTLPKLHRSVILDGCGHWTQQERPDEVNEALVDFLGSL